MAKIIKKIIRGLLIITAVLVVVPLILFLLLQTPLIQTWTVNRVTKAVSRETGAEIMIGRVSYSLWHEIVLDDVLLKDLNGDTIIAARKVDMRLREIRPSQKIYKFRTIDLHEPDFRMIRDTAGVMNLTAYLQSLKSDRERDSTRNIEIHFADIDLLNGSFTLSDMSDTVGVIPGGVNYRNMYIRHITGKVNDLRVIPDSVSMVIRGLAFQEDGGFISRSLDMNMAVAESDLYFRDFDLLTDSSAISAEKILIMPREKDSWKDFINDVRLDFLFDNSIVNTSDISYFVRPLNGVSEKVSFSGRVTGTVAEMKGKNIRIDYESSTRLRFDFDISGLPEINDSYLYISFTDMKTRAADIERFTLPGRKPFRLPAVAHDIGLVTYKGSFTGFTTDFVSFGRFTTERGTFDTDLSLKPDGRNAFGFRGSLRTSAVDLGYMTKKSEMFGGLWMHAEVDGTMKSFRHLSANINGVIDSVEINKYLYRNITVSGTYANKIWDGSVEVNEPNIRMSLLGRFDLEKSKPEFDFTMNLASADLHTLNLVTKDSIFRATALLTANFRGNSMENLEGDLRLINSTLENSNGKLNIYDFLVSSEIVGGVPFLKLRSDFADADVRGKYSVDAIKRSVAEIKADLFPSRFSKPVARKGESTSEAMFSLDTRIKRIDRLNEFFGTGLSISEGTLITGHFWSDRPEVIAGIEADAVTYLGVRMGRLNMTGSLQNGSMKLDLAADTVTLPDNSELGNFALGAISSNDTIDLGMNWDNHDNGRTLGEIRVRGFFGHSAGNLPSLTVAVLPASLTVNSSQWNITPARIVIDSVSAYFDNILVSSRTKYFSLGGRLSKDPDEKLTLTFEGLNMSYLNNLLQGKQDTKKPAQMKFEGTMSGNLTLSDVYNNLLFESSINITDFRLNDNNYGLMTIISEWDPGRKVAVINMGNDFAGKKLIDVSGTYSPTARVIDISASASDLPLDVLNPFLSSFASDIRGFGTGTIRLKGKLRQLEMTGAVMAHDASMKIDFLQTRYSFSDSVRFSPAGIILRNINIYDTQKNQGMINGMITHRAFRNFGVSLDINMDKMLVLNTRPKDNDSFYGTAYASGYAGIRGNDEKLVFNISARTAPDTEFFVPLNSSAKVSDYPFIEFLKPAGETGKQEQADRHGSFVRQEEGSKIELNFDLDVSPEAEVQLILDETSGGVIRGKGEGKLNISLNSRGDIRMAGDYVISEGDYFFTLGNILNKRFAVEKGGTVSWNGAIEDASLDIRALYKTKASLSEIFGEEEFTELKAKMPVECVLSLSGRLLNPGISFDISLPTADERTRELLRLAIDTEEELRRQFLYLLVMNSFCPDPSLYNSGAATGTPLAQGGYAASPIAGGVTTTTEMLSNQVSNWLSQISNDFDIGFSYRPGSELTDQEVELALSTQLLNDKVTVNGNVDVRGNQSNTYTKNITGEFTVEVRLTDMLRFKVFNRSNHNLYYQVHPYTQGVGLFFRRDFSTLKDLFIRPDEKKKKVNGDGESGKD